MLLEDIHGTSQRILKPLLVTLIPLASYRLVIKAHQTALGIIFTLFGILMVNLIGQQLDRNTEQQYQCHDINPSVIAVPIRKALVACSMAHQTTPTLHGVPDNALALKRNILQKCRHKQERNYDG